MPPWSCFPGPTATVTWQWHWSEHRVVRQEWYGIAKWICQRGIDLVAIPGGFSFGDYLRCGAVAARSPAMSAVRRFADAGGLVLGVCNGFQILVEAGLLPGAFLRNAGLRFVCRDVDIRVETANSPYTRKLSRRRTRSNPRCACGWRVLRDAGDTPGVERRRPGCVSL